jgi:hypothetical protein
VKESKEEDKYEGGRKATLPRRGDGTFFSRPDGAFGIARDPLRCKEENPTLIVRVHPDASISLDDPNNFTAFSIRAGDLSLDQIVRAFGADAEAGEEDHVWISIPRLQALGDKYGDGDWRKGCHGMIGFATSKGWVDKGRNLVRAHVDR